MAETEQVLDSLLHRWQELRSRGDCPTAEELCAQSPELVGRLKDRIAAILTMQDHLADTVSYLPASSRPILTTGRVGSYRLERLLGEGGMGAVFLAEDCLLQRQVALKLMKPRKGDEAVFRERFLREARAVAAIEDPHIVPIYQAGEDHGVLYLAMPVLKGQTLLGLLKQRGPLPIPLALEIGRQVAAGLHAAHVNGLIHRDVKPANIWLETSASASTAGRQIQSEKAPHVRLLDFGLARFQDVPTDITQSGVIVGTPAYMSPEQARGLQVGPRSDLFSLGVVLYQMLTGNKPFAGEQVFDILTSLAVDRPPPLVSANVAAPPELEALLDRLLAKDPDSRPACANDVALELALLLEQTERQQPDRRELDVATLALPQLPPPWTRKLLLAVTAFLVLAAATWLALHSLDRTCWRVFPDNPDVDRGSRRPLNASWVQHVKPMPPAAQAREVADELKRRNPGFSGQFEYATDPSNTRVLEFGVATDHVTDVSPIVALEHLQGLGLYGSEMNRGQLDDLSPIRSLKLVHLECHCNPIRSLESLTGMPLVSLNCWNTRVHDLTPLEGMKLERLTCSHTLVKNITVLRDLPLQELDLGGSPVESMEPLRGMAIVKLGFNVEMPRDRDVLLSLTELKILNREPFDRLRVSTGKDGTVRP